MKTIDDTLLIPLLESGDKLYHYTSAAGLKGICEEGFWVTERGFLNDITEFQVANDVFCDILNSHMNDENRCMLIKDKVSSEVEQLQSPGLSTNGNSGDYVISFCRDYDSPLMWSSYANYTGYCLQFDYDTLVESFEKKTLLLHGQVVYDHDEQIRLMEKAIETEFFKWPEYDYINSWDDFDKLTEKDIDNWYKTMAIVVSAYNMFFKLPCFEGEHEYRFVFYAGHNSGNYEQKDYKEQRFKIKDEVLIPYIQVPLKSLDAIEKVLVGSKNKSDIAIKGVRYFFRNLKKNIVIEKSPMPLRY